VACVVRAFQVTLRDALAYQQIQAIDAEPTKIGRPWPRAVWQGDIRRRVERAGGWWPHPTTSASAFRRSFAERLLTLPPPIRETYLDTYLAGPPALVGLVVGLLACPLPAPRPEHLVLGPPDGRRCPETGSGEVPPQR
jgi:hypothetical protein